MPWQRKFSAGSTLSQKTSALTHLASTGAPADVVIENASLGAQVADLIEKLQVMTSRMARMTRRVFGASSETHYPDQRHLDEIRRQIGVENDLRPDDATAATVVSAGSTAMTTGASPSGAVVPAPAKPRTKRRGRLLLPDTLSLEERFSELAESERLGPHGKPLPQIGTQFVDTLDHFPVWFRRLRPHTRDLLGPGRMTG